MRISNLLPAVCAAALIWGNFTVLAQDNPAQAAARAALMKEMNALNAQHNQATNLAAAASVTIPPAANPKPAAPPAKTAPAKQPAPPAKPKPAPPSPSAAPKPAAASSQFFSPVPPPSNPKIKTPGATAAQGPAAMPPAAKAAKPAPPASAPAAPPASAPAAPPAPAPEANYPGKSLGFNPIPSPPLPVTPRQDAQLRALLSRYMANEITPAQYQKARAAILAEH